MARFEALTGICFLALLHVTMSITVIEFFPTVKGNLTQIKWAHRTNSQAALKTALNRTDIHMIEADVVLGVLKTADATSPQIPIMGHPPDNTSDLTLEDFLGQVLANKKKGIKLDFKSTAVFNKSIEILQKTTNLTQVPVWLNADILKGPVNPDSEPVDAKTFFNGTAKLPKVLLSVGWTTKLEPTQNVTTANYTDDQLTEMSKFVVGSNQSVTYPVRACFAANDVSGFAKLLNDTKANNATLTIWSSEGDAVNATLLSAVIKRIGLDKVYLDVPASLEAKLDLSGSASASQISLALMIAALVATFSGAIHL